MSLFCPTEYDIIRKKLNGEIMEKYIKSEAEPNIQYIEPVEREYIIKYTPSTGIFQVTNPIGVYIGEFQSEQEAQQAVTEDFDARFKDEFGTEDTIIEEGEVGDYQLNVLFDKLENFV